MFAKIDHRMRRFCDLTFERNRNTRRKSHLLVIPTGAGDRIRLGRIVEV